MLTTPAYYKVNKRWSNLLYLSYLASKAFFSWSYNICLIKGIYNANGNDAISTISTLLKQGNDIKCWKVCCVFSTKFPRRNPYEIPKLKKLKMPFSFIMMSSNWPMALFPRGELGLHLAVFERRQQTFEFTHILSQRQRCESSAFFKKIKIF